jgi:hypothetical protein
MRQGDGWRTSLPLLPLLRLHSRGPSLQASSAAAGSAGDPPACTDVTPSPTLSTTPAASWPRMQGKRPAVEVGAA